MAAFFQLSFFLFISTVFTSGEDVVDEVYSIKGKLSVKKELSKGHNDWLKRTHIFVDGGKYIGIPK